MFERYTERARRVIFFARYEASVLGVPSIETEHLLLGLLREGWKLTSGLFGKSDVSTEAVRREIQQQYRQEPGRPISTSVDIPLSPESKRVLGHAAEEAERMLHDYIGVEHILLGLLREEKSLAARILTEKGMRLSSVREDLARLLSKPRPDDTSGERTIVMSGVLKFEVDAEGIVSLSPPPEGSHGALANAGSVSFDMVPAGLRTVLVADEDESYRRFLRLPLATRGFAVHDVGEGEEAFQFALENRPSLILSDVSLPPANGFELCRRVRAHRSLDRTRVLFVSAADGFEYRRKAFEAGADDFLSKHLPLREVLLRILLVLARLADPDLT